MSESPERKKKKISEEEEEKREKGGADHDNSSTFFRLKAENILEREDNSATYAEERHTINGLPISVYMSSSEKYCKVKHCQVKNKLKGGIMCTSYESFCSTFYFNFAIEFKLVNFIDDSKSKIVKNFQTREGYLNPKYRSKAEFDLMDWNELTDVKKGFIQNGAIILEVNVRPGRFGFVPLSLSFDFSVPSEISDVTLVVEGSKSFVSKQILAHHSSYFKCLFYGYFKESKETEIELKDLAHRDFQSLLSLFYGDETKISSLPKVRKIIPLLDRFDCEGLKLRVQLFLMMHPIALKLKIGIASEYRLNYLLGHSISKLYTSAQIKKVIDSDEYPYLTNEIKEELQNKMKHFEELEAKGPVRRTMANLSSEIPDILVQPRELDFSAPSEISDAILVVEGRKVHVSSQILAHHSPYFKTLFYGDLKEFKEQEIDLGDIVHKDFLIFLNLIYGDKNQLCWLQLKQLFPLLNKFDCEGLKHKAQLLVIERIGIDVTTKMVMACEYQLNYLLDHCIANMNNKFTIENSMRSKEYGKLPEYIRKELKNKKEKLHLLDIFCD